METSKIVIAYRLINKIKISNMDDDGKIKVIKAIKAMKPIYTEFEDFSKDAQEKLKDDDFEKMSEKSKEWQGGIENTSLSEKERVEVNAYFGKYYEALNKCLKEESEKENEITYEKLSEQEFCKLVGNNDLNLDEIITLEEVLC